VEATANLLGCRVGNPADSPIERRIMKKLRCTRTGCKFNKKGYCQHPNPEREKEGEFCCFSFEPEGRRNE